MILMSILFCKYLRGNDTVDGSIDNLKKNNTPPPKKKKQKKKKTRNRNNNNKRKIQQNAKTLHFLMKESTFYKTRSKSTKSLLLLLVQANTQYQGNNRFQPIKAGGTRPKDDINLCVCVCGCTMLCDISEYLGGERQIVPYQSVKVAALIRLEKQHNYYRTHDRRPDLLGLLTARISSK